MYSESDVSGGFFCAERFCRCYASLIFLGFNPAGGGGTFFRKGSNTYKTVLLTEPTEPRKSHRHFQRRQNIELETILLQDYQYTEISGARNDMHTEFYSESLTGAGILKT
jgi:hypothetical protein